MTYEEYLNNFNFKRILIRNSIINILNNNENKKLNKIDFNIILKRLDAISFYNNYNNEDILFAKLQESLNENQFKTLITIINLKGGKLNDNFKC